MKQNKTLQAAHTAAIETAGKALLEKMETAWKKCKEAEQAERYKEAHEHEQMFTEFLAQLQKFPTWDCVAPSTTIQTTAPDRL